MVALWHLIAVHYCPHCGGQLASDQTPPPLPVKRKSFSGRLGRGLAFAGAALVGALVLSSIVSSINDLAGRSELLDPPEVVPFTRFKAASIPATSACR